MALCNFLLKEIFRYIHEDYHLLICKKSIKDDDKSYDTNNRKLLSLSIILNGKLHLQDSFSLIILSKFRLILHEIVHNKHYDILLWLNSKKNNNLWKEPIMLDIIMNACNNNNLTLLLNLSKIGMPKLMNSTYSYQAAENGNIDMLQFLYEEGCLFNSTTFIHAAIGGDRSTFEFAERLINLDKELYLNTRVSAAAACFGRLSLLQYLRDILKCPWDSECCRLSAYNRHYDVTVYCVKNGCRWNVFDS